MRARSVFLATSVGLLAGVIPLAGDAAAIAPPNDDIANATVVDSLSFTDTVDTTDATTTSEDLALNATCGAPAVGHMVWYQLQIPGAGGAIVTIDTTGSSFSTGLFVATGTPGSLNLALCGPRTIAGVVLDASGGGYYVGVFGDGAPPPTSGTLVLAVRETAPAPEIAMTVDPTGVVDRQGVAHISGTLTCTAQTVASATVFIDATLTQNVGRFTIRGFGFDFREQPCDGSTVRWAAAVVGDNGKFAGGKAATVAFGTGCTELCNGAFVEATVQLRKGR